MDTDDDGILDIIATCYFKGAHIFKGLGKGKYADKKEIVLANGKGIGSPGLRYTAFSVFYEDWDDDGDYDLVTNDIFNKDGLIVFTNDGNNKNPSFNPDGTYLKTISGKRINGFCLLYYDLDGDGLKDIIGEGYASYTWFKNVGTKAAPKFEDKKAFIGKILSREEVSAAYAKTPYGAINEAPEKSTHPAWGKIHFSFGDINGDGKDDLLVGDAYTHNSKGRDLTAEEQQKYDELSVKISKLEEQIAPTTKKIQDLVTQAQKENKMSEFEVPKNLRKIQDEIFGQMTPLQNEQRELDAIKLKSERFGRVWVYLRK